ncbi:MAG: GTPase Era [Lachnospiraceae bacterium]|nr:GTPase Era [Lachnospiraceae bacterium]
MDSRFKAGFVSIVGRPNVGKSTLMNRIVGQKIAITSNKPQTTRNKITAVYTDEEGQIVFLDTPGLHKAKNKLGGYMMNAADSALKDADVLLYMLEANARFGSQDEEVLEKLSSLKMPKILVINKIDAVTGEALMAVTKELTAKCDFDETVPVSAVEGTNVDELIKVIKQYLPYGEPFFDEDTVTDQPVRQIAAEMIREKALHALNEEIPHGIAVVMEKMDFSGKTVQVEATIICEKESHKGIIIGKGGSMLKKIGSNARFEIEKMLERQINLKLFVKVKDRWRDSDFLLKNFGYNNGDFKL